MDETEREEVARLAIIGGAKGFDCFDSCTHLLPSDMRRVRIGNSESRHTLLVGGALGAVSSRRGALGRPARFVSTTCAVRNDSISDFRYRTSFPILRKRGPRRSRRARRK